jgi:outer membrane protein
MRYVLLLILVALHLHSGDFVKAEVGAGVWYVESTGEVSYKGSPIDLDDDLGLDSTLSTYAWANFKHFIPVIPNARLEITKFGTDATKYIPAELTKRFDGENNISGNVNSKLNLDQIDAILYYNLLDTLLTLDVGIGVKYYIGSLEVDGRNLDVDFPLPIIYGRVGAEIPFTNIGAEIDLKYFKFSPEVSAEMFDLRVKATATVLTLALIDLNIEAGYRVNRLQILASKNSFSDFKADIKSEVSGFFAGINLSF